MRDAGRTLGATPWVCRFTLALIWLGLEGPALAQFRIAPYLQNVGPDSIHVVWWSEEPVPGTLEWGTSDYGQSEFSSPLPAPIATVTAGVEDSMQHPYRHEVRLSGLETNTAYLYRVTQGEARWEAQFRTAVALKEGFSFVVAADPESKATEPQRSAIHRAVLRQIQAKSPRFLIYAGDLVDEGNAQDDWDSFWSDLVQPTPGESLASQVSIYAALGNHDYDGLNTTLKGNSVPYAQPYAEAGVAKYRAYFTFPGNNHAPGDPRHERYYRLHYGAVSIFVLDTNNDSISTDDPNTNWDTGRYRRHPLVGENETPEEGAQSYAPDIHGGMAGHTDSLQYQWLVETLEQASLDSAFIFVVNHHAPYSSFVHGDPNEHQSSHPIRKLDGLFHRFGVDAVFSGHDESYERSVTVSDGHEIHYYLLPTIGDPSGLRVPEENPGRQQGFSRYIYPLDNRQHGYLSVRVEYLGFIQSLMAGLNRYRVTITPYYYDPADPENSELHYEDVVELLGSIGGGWW